MEEELKTVIGGGLALGSKNHKEFYHGFKVVVTHLFLKHLYMGIVDVFTKLRLKQELRNH